MVSRRVAVAVAVAAAIGLAGCAPEIVSGAYYCGPQMACPDDLVCNPADGRCVRDELARPFACMPDTQADEPNDDAATATSLAVSGCPSTATERFGCIPAADDVDWIAVAAPTLCEGAPLSIDVRYSVAFSPAVVDLVAGDGTVLATAAPCEITGGIGANDAVCLDTAIPAGAAAVVRIALDRELDCDGACDFMHYSITATAGTR